MDDSAQSDARLEVSVSFGRFENDALSWEKWSSFSPNKYLEEVGTLSTPGSVAQKKAYFEAHYKRIAAKKAEELELENSIGPVKPSPNVSSNGDPIADSSKNDTEFGLCNGEKTVEEEACITTLANVDISGGGANGDGRSSNGDEEGACTNGLEEEIEGSVIAEKCEASAIEEAKVVSNLNVDDAELNARNDEVVVAPEIPLKNAQHILDEPPESKKGIKQASAPKKEVSKSNARNVASKVTPMKNERNLGGTKKKVVPSAAKPLQASSTPKNAKPTSISTPVSASKKKVNGSVVPKSKNPDVGKSKRVAPTSLHMSLSLGPADSLGALPMTRKSLIMERMGDKDIVKRAFKTFQNRTNVSTGDERPSTEKNVPSTASEPKIPSYRTPTKGNEGLRKDAEKRASQRSQTGTRSNPLPSGSYKSSPLVKKSTTAVSPATALKSDDKAEKRKEFLKKLGEKSIAREAENSQRGAKSKVVVENGIRQRPTLNR